MLDLNKLDLKNINIETVKKKLVDNIKNYNIDYDELNDTSINENVYKEEIKKNFRLPIMYLSNKQKLQDSIKTDLELSNNKNLYKYVCNPNTTISKLTAEYWSDYYTCDTKFLNDSIQLINKYKFLPNNLFETDKQTLTIKNKNIVDNIFSKWTEIKSDTGFADKYGYINWNHLNWLNKSSLFLEISSMYNFISPLLSLIVPIILLLIPFFILKFKKIKINLNQYIDTLKKIGKNNILVKIFDFNKQTLDKKFYLIGTLFFYVFQMYQNILICLRFYLNLTSIHDFLFSLKIFLHMSIKELTNFSRYTHDLVTYDNFTIDLNNNKQVLSKIYNKLLNISPFNLTIKKVFDIGYVLKVFYEINNDETLSKSLFYLFGFNGYLENVANIQLNNQNNIISHCNFTNKKTSIEKGYYPTLIKSNPIKNNVSLRKNIIITGPNAAGKTTILKSSLFNVILSQQIGFGFYEKAEINPYKYIHCYLNIPDTSGRDSLFQAEARRCKDILDIIISSNKKERHFCIFDELFSGTNPYEAVSSAYAYLKYISSFNNVDFMLTTHFITLCNRINDNKRIKNCHMKTSYEKNKIVYCYKLKKGVSEIKGGITVLQNLDYPLEIINQTKNIIKTLN